MSKVVWFLTTASLGVATYILLKDSPLTAAIKGNDAHASVGRQGTQKRVSGTGNELIGKLKQGMSEAKGDKNLQGSGVVDQAEGAAQDVVGKAAGTVQNVSDELKS